MGLKNKKISGGWGAAALHLKLKIFAVYSGTIIDQNQVINHNVYKTTVYKRQNINHHGYNTQAIKRLCINRCI